MSSRVAVITHHGAICTLIYKAGNLSHRTRHHNLVINEFAKEALLALLVELAKDIVKQDEWRLACLLLDVGCFEKFESEHNGADFAARCSLGGWIATK